MNIAFIRPLMEYSASVWDNCTLQNKKLLDSVHNEAARIITGANKLCSVDKTLAELGWETLQERRNKQKLVIFYKMLHNESPTYLCDLLPPLVKILILIIWETRMIYELCIVELIFFIARFYQLL